MATPDNPQDGSQSQQDSPQKHDSITVFDPRRGQHSISGFERCISSSYPFQTSLLTNLTRLDWKNLQLAGIRTHVSRAVQQKYLVPSKCNEKLRDPGSKSKTCSNTTQTVKEIKACHGQVEDGWVLQGGSLKWVTPSQSRLYKHVRDKCHLVLQSHENEGGYFDSFNVCIECHDRDRLHRLPFESRAIRGFHSVMCRGHSLEYREQQPYNMCRCEMFMDQHWRCHACAVDTLDLLKQRAQAFLDDAIDTNTNYILDIVNLNLNFGVPHDEGAPEADRICPMFDCDGQPWVFGSERMLLCRVCTAIFPTADQRLAS